MIRYLYIYKCIHTKYKCILLCACELYLDVIFNSKAMPLAMTETELN